MVAKSYGRRALQKGTSRNENQHPIVALSEAHQYSTMPRGGTCLWQSQACLLLCQRGRKIVAKLQHGVTSGAANWLWYPDVSIGGLLSTAEVVQVHIRV